MRSGKAHGADILGFVKFFHTLEKKVGIGRIVEKLSELEEVRPDKALSTIKTRIIEEICRLYGMAPKTLLHSPKRGNVTQARVMGILLLHKHLKLTKTELADLFGHSQPNIISIRIKTFNNVIGNKPIYDSERRFEKVYSKDFMNKFTEVDGIITELLSSKPLTDWKKW